MTARARTSTAVPTPSSLSPAAQAALAEDERTREPAHSGRAEEELMGKWPIRDAMKAKSAWEDASDAAEKRCRADVKAGRRDPDDDSNDPAVVAAYDNWQAARKEMWR